MPVPPRLISAAIGAVLLAGAASAADPPEVVRLRVPSGRVKTLFPAGTELRVLPRDDFEALARKARERAASSSPSEDRPRLLRARHEMRLEGDRLVGRSELTHSTAPAPEASIPLEPWTPALDGPAATIRVGPDGRLVLGASGPGGEATTALTWEQRADPATAGRSFRLGLPAVAGCRLALDLPEGIEPVLPGGIRQGPAPGASPDRRVWRLDAPPGPWNLRLRPPRGADDGEVPIAIRGVTRIDASESPARWSLEATVDPGPGGPRRLRLRLDPGLELVDLSGPGVSSYRWEASDGGATLVSLRLADAVEGPTAVTIRALGRVDDGAWTIPSYSAPEALWTGGRTLVRLAPGQVVASARPLGGRQVTPRATEREFGATRTGLILAFESSEPGPPAELTLRHPGADVSADVLGVVTLPAREAARLEARITWRVARGRLPTLSADLPPGWTPDRVAIRGLEAPPNWHVEARPGGGSRLVVRPPPTPESDGPIALEVSALAEREGPGDEIALPRVVPIGARVADEVWSLRPEAGLVASPRSARGLAWLDPSTLDPTVKATATRPALAWRWTAGDGRATVSVGADSSPQAVEAWTVATARGGRLDLDFYLSAPLADRSRPALVASLPAVFADLSLRWDVPGEPGRAVEAERAGAGSWRIPLPRDGRERFVVHARATRPREASGRVPLMRVGPGRGTLLVRSDRGDRVEIAGKGLARLDPAWAASAFLQGAGADPADGPRGRPSYAFAYDAASEAPELAMRRLPPAGPGGAIEEARLSTRAARGGRSLHRLSLRIVPGADRSLEIVLPADTTPERAELEGASIEPVSVGGAIRVPLPVPTPLHPAVELELDYLGPSGSDPASLRPTLPRLSLPCLAFLWDVDLPASRAAGTAGGGLVAWGEPTERPEPRRDAEAAAGAALDGRVRRISASGRTLGAWLVRLDGGGVPIVVDRPALEAAGWGPRTPLEVPRDLPKGASAVTTFARLGLALAVRSGCAVVSLPGMGHDAEGVALAASLGHDRTDRYQSVARWRGEATPGPGGRPARPDAGGAERQPRGFAATGWPSVEARVEVIDPAARGARSGAVVLALALLGWVGRRLPAVARALALFAAMASALLLRLAPEVATGLLGGGCVAAGIWLGIAWRPLRRPAPPAMRTRSTLSRGVGVGAAVVLAVAMADRPSPAQEAVPAAPNPSAPIVVLFPYDPPYDADAPADRAILRLEDYERLRSLADARPGAPEDGPWLVAALHEARREGPHDARVASAFDLRLAPEAGGPRTWKFPADGARDLSANLDGRDVPVRLGEDGATASVEIVGPGTHRLIVRRLVALSRAAPGETLRLTVPAIASARLRVEAPADGPTVTARSARGRVEMREGILEAALGPATTLEIRWNGREGAGPPAPRGSAEATILWDVEPAGDRVRARIMSRAAEGLDRLALALEPGTSVRSADRPGFADATRKRSPRGDVWEMPIDPPLMPGQFATVELWRPVAKGGALRRMPRVEPLGLAEFSGLIGVRRPADWAGRLAAEGGVEPVPDDLFARAWGAFPDASATLAGASSFVGPAELAIAAGPDREIPKVRPAVAIELAAGRMDVRADLEVTDEYGPSRDLDVAIPADLRLVRVEAAGMTDWARPSADRLRLRFDSEPHPPARTVRIAGFVPIDDDPATVGPIRSQADVPWPIVRRADRAIGSLVIAAPSSITFRLEPGAGVAATAPPSVAAGVFRAAFSIPAGAAPGRLRWTTEAPGVSVRVQSLVILHPDSVEWVATARYATPWGPCPPIRLRLPSEWADSATAEVAGVPVAPDSETAGRRTDWTFRPREAPWGGARVVVRARRPRTDGKPLPFPDLVPLGRPGTDRVDSYLGYADLSGAPDAIEGSAELQPVDGARWDEKDLPWPPVAPRNVLRVLKEGWSLRFLPSGWPSATADGAVVALADVECTLSEDGSLLGRASYDLDGRPADFLRVAMPEGSEPLAASVDGVATIARREAPGRIAIPLPEAGSARVVMAWRGEPVGAGETGARRLALPTLPGPSCPTLVSVAAPDGAAFTATGKARAAIPAELELARAERKSRALVERIATLDRGSPRDRSALLGALVRFEIQARAAERAATAHGAMIVGWTIPAVNSPLRDARAALAEALTSSGLDDFARSAAARAGREGTDPLADLAEPPEPTAALRVRPIGRMATFRDETGGGAISWSIGRTARPISTRPAGVTWLALSLGGIAAMTATRWRRPGMLALGASAILASPVLIPGAALTLGGCLIGAIAGRSPIPSTGGAPERPG